MTRCGMMPRCAAGERFLSSARRNGAARRVMARARSVLASGLQRGAGQKPISAHGRRRACTAAAHGAGGGGGVRKGASQDHDGTGFRERGAAGARRPGLRARARQRDRLSRPGGSDRLVAVRCAARRARRAGAAGRARTETTTSAHGAVCRPTLCAGAPSRSRAGGWNGGVPPPPAAGSPPLRVAPPALPAGGAGHTRRAAGAHRVRPIRHRACRGHRVDRRPDPVFLHLAGVRCASPS